MRIHTYYSNVPENRPEDELRLLTLWRTYHAALGFEPFVLSEYHARRHPYFENFKAAVSKLPSVNAAGYDLACYYRWMAMATVAGGIGIMADYDTFLTNLWRPVPSSGQEMQKLRVYQNCTPCLVVGTAHTFLEACNWFAGSVDKPVLQTINGQPHTSDMIILQGIASAVPDAFTRLDLVKCYGEDGWTNAPAIHFSNASTGPAGKQPRWRHVPTLLKEASTGRAGLIWKEVAK
jgi:hypothetical protein